MNRAIDDTSAAHKTRVAQMTRNEFVFHRMTWDAKAHRWWLARPGTGFYSFSLYFGPGVVVMFGDIGDVVAQCNDHNSLAWVLRCHEDHHYVLSKVRAIGDGGKEEFFPGDAVQYVSDLISQYPEKDDDGEPDEHNVKYCAKLRAVVDDLRAGIHDDEPRRVWWEAWNEHMEDGDCPDLMSPSSGALWFWHALNLFARLYREGEAIGRGVTRFFTVWGAL